MIMVEDKEEGLLRRTPILGEMIIEAERRGEERGGAVPAAAKLRSRTWYHSRAATAEGAAPPTSTLAEPIQPQPLPSQGRLHA
ncbi:hypothetical protein WMF04_12670 [Sorangium sp. So ce260]|uniref:hypothetical protein n=1 Tax=Sorangium sp. So ce260 TaxID=3133291 RepID=UPI003F61A67F